MKEELKNSLILDSYNYKAIIGRKCWWHQIHTNPISDQYYIWKYIKTLRYSEYYLSKKNIWHKLMFMWGLHRLRKISRITGFQIPPGTIGPGITIWHWGPIIVNPAARIGKNCTLNPMVIIGHKKPGEAAPQIGDNVFIGGGAKIIGAIHIGNNVTIAPNAVVVKDIEDNCIVGGIPCKVIGYNKKRHENPPY